MRILLFVFLSNPGLTEGLSVYLCPGSASGNVHRASGHISSQLWTEDEYRAVCVCQRSEPLNRISENENWKTI